jgi:hypothetical protein
VVEAYPCFPSHLVAVPLGAGSTTLLVDVVKGTVKSSDLWLNAWALPSLLPAAASAGAAPTLGLGVAVAAAAAAVLAWA